MTHSTITFVSLPNELINHIFSFNNDPQQRLVCTKLLEIWNYYNASAIDKYEPIILDHFSKNPTVLKAVKNVLNLPQKSLKERAIKIRKIAEIIYCSKAKNFEKIFTKDGESIHGKMLLKKIKHYVNCLIELNKVFMEKDFSDDYHVCEFYNEWSTFPEELYFKLHLSTFVKNKDFKQESIARAITTSLSVGIPPLELLQCTEEISDSYVKEQCLTSMCNHFVRNKQFPTAHLIATKIINPNQKSLQLAIIKEYSSQ